MQRFAPSLKTADVLDIINSGFEAGTTYFINWEMITKKKVTEPSTRAKEKKPV